MKTKLVYVLTCEPEDTYIEQALMAVWSARYWNPDAHIVLLTDNKTSALLHAGDARGEILQYISEEVVTTFDEDKNMHYRSRWLKTKARELVKGDMLFIDCDTICCKSLESVDSFDCEVGAVPDSHLPISEYNDDMFENVEAQARILGWDIRGEKYYFNSGVMFSKNTPKTQQLYSKWHMYWIEGYNNHGIKADQPALAKANIDCNHIISNFGNEYNNLLYTQNITLRNSFILHIWSFNNSSLLFSNRVLKIINSIGLAKWIKECIINIHSTYLPFDTQLKNSTFRERLDWLREVSSFAKTYHNCVDKYFNDWHFNTRLSNIVKWLLCKNFYKSAIMIWMISRLYTISNKKIKQNICSNEL